MNKLFVFVLSLLLHVAVFGQSENYYYITGLVINKETNQPLPGASVFAQNTTIGTVTNAEGRFSLKLPAGGYDIVVTYSGLTTDSKRITASDPDIRSIQFELKQKEKEMEAVSVISTTEVKDGYKKYGTFFLDHFIGKTVNSASCMIRNPEVLKFYFSRKRNRLKVLATEPLQIENKALGYNIRYSLDSFTYAYDNQVSLYTGYPLFEEMVPDNLEQEDAWLKARQVAYKGSILHFMRSVYNKRLFEDGYDVQFLINYRGKDSAFVLKNIYAGLNYKKDDSTNTVDIKPNQHLVAVLYSREKPAQGYLSENKTEITAPVSDSTSFKISNSEEQKEPTDFQLSILNFAPGESLTIEQNGYYFEQNDISISEYWTWEKVADQLPYNYIPMME